MSKLKLSIATTDYDHFRDFRLGEVQAQGIDHNWLNLGHHECFARFTANREFDLAELSFAKFTAQVTRENSDIIGLPVICSRLFRFSSFYVNRKSNIKTVEDLRGKKIGSPEWAHSAAVYMRGWMHNEMGVKLTDVHWVQAGANAPGRKEKVELNLPEGMQLTRIADKSLSELLAAGEIDYLCAHATSTPAGDAAEAANIRAVFGAKTPPISSLKSMTGHELWMSGASQVVYSTIMAQQNFTAANINYSRPSKETAGLNILRETTPQAPTRVLCNSAGFGGTNSALVLAF